MCQNTLPFKDVIKYFWPSGSEEEDFKSAIYRHGGHLGHVTINIYINFHSHFLTMRHVKFVFD